MTRTTTLGELLGLARAGGLVPQGRPTLTIVELEHADWDLAPAVVAALARPHGLLVGSSTSPLPPEAEPLLEVLTTTLAPDGPGRAWVDGDLAALETSVDQSPRAALALGQVLDATRTRSDASRALAVESLAYSMLLASSEFRAWRDRTPRRTPLDTEASRVRTERDGDVLTVVLDRPARHNAFDASMREALLDALGVAEVDDSIARVVLSGAGPSFCSGGDLDEFGSATDPAEAHHVRLTRSVGLAVHRLRSEVEARLHGAAIGAGIEIPAFADRVVASPGTWFQLPELGMGLIPGAGGTVSLPRRIGAQRTAYLGLTGARIDAELALAWGLVDDIR